MSQLRSIENLKKIKDKKVFLRVDFNVPISGGRVSDTTKIEKLQTNIKNLLDNNCNGSVDEDDNPNEGVSVKKFEHSVELNGVDSNVG